MNSLSPRLVRRNAVFCLVLVARLVPSAHGQQRFRQHLAAWSPGAFPDVPHLHASVLPWLPAACTGLGLPCCFQGVAIPCGSYCGNAIFEDTVVFLE